VSLEFFIDIIFPDTRPCSRLSI